MKGTEEIPPQQPISPTQRKLLKIKRTLLGRYLRLTRTVLAFALIIFVLMMLIGIKNLLADTTIGKYAYLAKIFIFTPSTTIESINDRTNILILGKAGEGHTAPDLTDTIMLASDSHKDPQSVTLISLPRDIWIEDLRTKLNSVYYWGNEKQELGGGLILAKSSVEEIVGIPVHYAAVIDFSGFTDVIDAIGGIEVNVLRSFTDSKYPIPGKENDDCEGMLVQAGDPEYACRYEVLDFTKGPTIMDGDTALKFSRSRQSQDKEEGTDMARSKRQQLVLKAVKNKVVSSEILFSPSKISNLINIGSDIIETDMPLDVQALLARRALQSKDNLKSYTLPEDLLINPPISGKYDNLYVFVASEDSWSPVAAWVKGLIN